MVRRWASLNREVSAQLHFLEGGPGRRGALDLLEARVNFSEFWPNESARKLNLPSGRVAVFLPGRNVSRVGRWETADEFDSGSAVDTAGVSRWLLALVRGYVEPHGRRMAIVDAWPADADDPWTDDSVTRLTKLSGHLVAVLDPSLRDRRYVRRALQLLDPTRGLVVLGRTRSRPWLNDGRGLRTAVRQAMDKPDVLVAGAFRGDGLVVWERRRRSP